MPTIRNTLSGVWRALAIARLAAPGKAANTRPSMAKTKPSAIRKSDMHPTARRSRGLQTRSFPLSCARLAGRIDEVTEELGIRPQQHARIVVLHAGLVGLHRAVKVEEVRVLA